MARIGEAATKTHLAQRERWIAEQLSGAFQAALQDVLVRAASGARLEQLGEMEGAHARSLREFFQMNVAIEVGVNELSNAIETHSRHAAGPWLRCRRIRQVDSQRQSIRRRHFPPEILLPHRFEAPSPAAQPVRLAVRIAERVPMASRSAALPVVVRLPSRRTPGSIECQASRGTHERWVQAARLHCHGALTR